jgi:hypothetical protein
VNVRAVPKLKTLIGICDNEIAIFGNFFSTNGRNIESCNNCSEILLCNFNTPRPPPVLTSKMLFGFEKRGGEEHSYRPDIREPSAIDQDDSAPPRRSEEDMNCLQLHDISIAVQIAARTTFSRL